ncbi:MAG: hypothetical protein KC588_16540 [Nitrospira sp.]|nr:hypothetical protein [Nitrospira sp.]
MSPSYAVKAALKFLLCPGRPVAIREEAPVCDVEQLVDPNPGCGFLGGHDDFWLSGADQACHLTLIFGMREL